MFGKALLVPLLLSLDVAWSLSRDDFTKRLDPRHVSTFDARRSENATFIWQKPWVAPPIDGVERFDQPIQVASNAADLTISSEEMSHIPVVFRVRTVARWIALLNRSVTGASTRSLEPLDLATLCSDGTGHVSLTATWLLNGSTWQPSARAAVDYGHVAMSTSARVVNPLGAVLYVKHILQANASQASRADAFASLLRGPLGASDRAAAVVEVVVPSWSEAASVLRAVGSIVEAEDALSASTAGGSGQPAVPAWERGGVPYIAATGPVSPTGCPALHTGDREGLPEGAAGDTSAHTDDSAVANALRTVDSVFAQRMFEAFVPTYEWANGFATSWNMSIEAPDVDSSGAADAENVTDLLEAADLGSAKRWNILTDIARHAAAAEAVDDVSDIVVPNNVSAEQATHLAAAKVRTAMYVMKRDLQILSDGAASVLDVSMAHRYSVQLAGARVVRLIAPESIPNITTFGGTHATALVGQVPLPYGLVPGVGVVQRPMPKGVRRALGGADALPGIVVQSVLLPGDVLHIPPMWVLDTGAVPLSVAAGRNESCDPAVISCARPAGGGSASLEISVASEVMMLGQLLRNAVWRFESDLRSPTHARFITTIDDMKSVMTTKAKKASGAARDTATAKATRVQQLYEELTRRKRFEGTASEAIAVAAVALRRSLAAAFKACPAAAVATRPSTAFAATHAWALGAAASTLKRNASVRASTLDDVALALVTQALGGGAESEASATEALSALARADTEFASALKSAKAEADAEDVSMLSVDTPIHAGAFVGGGLDPDVLPEEPLLHPRSSFADSAATVAAACGAMRKSPSHGRRPDYVSVDDLGGLSDFVEHIFKAACPSEKITNSTDAEDEDVDDDVDEDEEEIDAEAEEGAPRRGKEGKNGKSRSKKRAEQAEKIAKELGKDALQPWEEAMYLGDGEDAVLAAFDLYDEMDPVAKAVRQRLMVDQKPLPPDDPLKAEAREERRNEYIRKAQGLSVSEDRVYHRTSSSRTAGWLGLILEEELLRVAFTQNVAAATAFRLTCLLDAPHGPLVGLSGDDVRRPVPLVARDDVGEDSNTKNVLQQVVGTRLLPPIERKAVGVLAVTAAEAVKKALLPPKATKGKAKPKASSSATKPQVVKGQASPGGSGSSSSADDEL